MKHRAIGVSMLIAALATIAAAADPATMPSHLQHKGDRVWIEGVPPLGWGRSGDNTFCGALASALKVSDHPMDYATLMGDTGLAFRTRWFHGTTAGEPFSPASPVGEFGEEIERASQSTGMELEVINQLDQPNKDMRPFAPKIVAELDAGRCVLAYDRTLNMMVVSGYEKAGARFLVCDYFSSGQTRLTPPGEFGPMLILVRPQKAPMSRPEAVRKAFRLAVEQFDMEETHKGEKGAFLMGKAAYKQWISDIESAGQMDAPMRQKLFQPSWWTFSSLVDARSAAAAYCRAALADVSPEARKPLREAANLFDASAKTGARMFADKDAFLGPWSGKSVTEWDDNVRQREVELLTDMLATDAQAIDQLREVNRLEKQ